MGKGVGYGKVILFGEHFVVHGAPAIAGGISNSASVLVQKSDKNKITTKQKVIQETSLVAIDGILKSMGIKEKYEVCLEGDLPTYGGLGSSAAFCVGLVRALADEIGVHLTNEQVNRHAYAGECTFHGNPSGVDNTVATHGGIVAFTRGKTLSENTFEFIELKKTLDLVVSFSGKYSPTQKMVELVASLKKDDQGEFDQFMDEYLDIEHHGRKALEKGQLDVIGKLMNSNQALLANLGVSDELNDRINDIALKAGALGAKVTGGGGGGCCIALASDKKHADEIAKALTTGGFKSFPTKILK